MMFSTRRFDIPLTGDRRVNCTVPTSTVGSLCTVGDTRTSGTAADAESGTRSARVPIVVLRISPFSPSEVELNAEFHQPPVERLRWLTEDAAGGRRAERSVRTVVIHHGTGIEHVIDVDVGPGPRATDAEDLAGAQIELIQTIAELRELRHDVYRDRPGAARQRAAQALLNLRVRVGDVGVVGRSRIALEDARDLQVVRQQVRRAQLHAVLERNLDVAVEQLLGRVDNKTVVLPRRRRAARRRAGLQ